MTTARYDAYRRVMTILEELREHQLHAEEHELLCDAAEGLLLAREGEEQERDRLLVDAWLVLSSLVRAGRWRYRSAEQVRRMLELCGPDRAPERSLALA